MQMSSMAYIPRLRSAFAMYKYYLPASCRVQPCCSQGSPQGNWLYPIRYAGLYKPQGLGAEWASAKLGAGPNGHVLRQKDLCTLDLVQPRADLLQGCRDCSFTKQTAVQTSMDGTTGVLMGLKLHAVLFHAVPYCAVLSCAAVCLCLFSTSCLPAHSLGGL